MKVHEGGSMTCRFVQQEPKPRWFSIQTPINPTPFMTTLPFSMHGPTISHLVHILQLLITAYGLPNTYIVLNLCHVLMVAYQAEQYPLMLVSLLCPSTTSETALTDMWQLLAELCMTMFSTYRSMTMELTTEVVYRMRFNSIFAHLNNLHALLGDFAYIIKLKDKLMVALLLVKIRNRMFLSRQSIVSHAILHVVFFVMVQQLLPVAGAQPLSNQSFNISLESSYFNVSSNPAHEMSTGISQSTYQIIGISLAAIAGITGISAAIWGPCLPKWWTDRRHAKPDSERGEDRQRDQIDQDQPAQHNEHTQSQVPDSSQADDNSQSGDDGMSSSNEEPDSGFYRHARNVDRLGNTTDASGEGSVSSERGYELQHIGMQSRNVSTTREYVVHMTAPLDNESEGDSSVIGSPIHSANTNTQVTWVSSSDDMQPSVATAPPNRAIIPSSLDFGTVADNETFSNESTGPSTHSTTNANPIVDNVAARFVGADTTQRAGASSLDSPVTRAHVQPHQRSESVPPSDKTKRHF
ncbi:hypothetical protein F4679DRAFT_486918 [Xylaria curta]|nr:hypothetical protein F4679DRAFT_486918 [Xylaria curta]